MKKNTIRLLILAALLLACLMIVLFKTGVIHGANRTPKSDIFAVKDTAKVTKVFIASMAGDNVLLTRKDGIWYVQDSIRAMDSKVEDLLSTIRNVTLQQTVPKTAQSNINKMMSVNAIKVEIYQTKPKFTLFGMQFFTKERLVKTYYMGPATMDNMANFAILEGLDEPCIVHNPGFKGFLTPVYSFKPVDWFNSDLFSTKITRIKTLEVKDFEHPEYSFTVEKTGARFFALYDAQHQLVPDYDTVKLLDMLAEYRDKNYELFITGLTEEQRDSIFRFNHFKTITLTDIDGHKTTLEMYRKLTPDALSLDAILGEDAAPNELPYNRDRFYAILNGNKQNLVQCQYYHFDRQLQPLPYFLKRQ